MRYAIVLAWSVFATQLLAAPSADIPARNEEPLHVLYDMRPPLVDRSGGALTGTIGERAQQALDRSGIRYVLQEMPVLRQLEAIQRGALPACALGRLKTAERIDSGVYSRPIKAFKGYVAVVRSDGTLPQPATLGKWANYGLNWGIQTGLHYSDYIQALMRQAGRNVKSFNSTHQHFAELLLARRIDFVLVQEDEAALMLQQVGSAPLRLVRLEDLKEQETRYFYCNRQVPEKTLKALDQALSMLKP